MKEVLILKVITALWRKYIQESREMYAKPD